MSEKVCLYVAGDINAELFEDVAAALHEAERDGVNVTLRICSDGGDALYGMGLFDIIRGMTVAVHTEAYGDVCSAATLIFMAGDRRRIAPYARLMWHNAWDSGAAGRFEKEDLRKQARELSQLDSLGNLALAEVLRISVERVEEWSDDTKWWTAEEAVNDGLAHELTRKVNK